MAEQGNTPLPDFVEEPFQIRDGVLWRCLNAVSHGLRWEPVGNVAELIERVSRVEAELVRAMDLVRHQRNELYDGGLIDEKEFAALVADSDSGQRVARLEAYDAVKGELAALRLRCERYEKPVSRKERIHYGLDAAATSAMDALLAARLKGE